MGKTILTGLMVGVAAGALTAGFASTANAGAIAYSTLEISNFQIMGAGGQLDVSDFNPAILDVDNSSSAAATLNGAGNSLADSAAGDTDVNQVCIGACAAGQNQFGQQPTGTQFSRADAQLLGAGITGVPGASQDTVTARTVAEVQLTDDAFATSGSETGTGTRFAFAGVGQELTFSFNADAALEAMLDQDDVVAQASVNWSLSIFQEGVSDAIFTFAPTGVGAGSPCSLNMTIATLDDDDGTVNYACSGLFTATSPFLALGNNYTLAISHTSDVRAEVRLAPPQVPEPAAAALLGLGLLGVAAYRRRSHKA